MKPLRESIDAKQTRNPNVTPAAWPFRETPKSEGDIIIGLPRKITA